MIVTCPKCQSKYNVQDGAKAAKVRCKKCQAVIEVAGADAASRAEMKTAVPSAPSSPQRAEMKTVVSNSSPARQRAEMKTGAPPAAPARQRAEMKTAAPSPAAPAAGGGGDLIGKVLGGYQVIRKLGEGGMGAVYEARQIALDRSVALKVLPPHLAANKEFITRFSREALSVAKLNHNNIIQIYDIGKQEGTYFFSMEFVRGTTLGSLIEKEGRMDADRAVGYILQAARGMEYAHRHKIIHRDIKPDNIMVNEDDIAKVADLGLAKQMGDQETSMTMAGVGMGTPVYMSPEQSGDAKNVDQRADIYSLGCTLYHMVTGKIPFTGSSAYEIITKHINEPLKPPDVVNPDVSPELSKVIQRMMAKKKEDRYQTMTEVIEGLEAYLGLDFAQAGFVPTESQIARLNEQTAAAAAALGAPTLKIAGPAIAALSALCLVFGAAWGKWNLALGAALFGLTTAAGYAFLQGFARKTYVYRRARKFLFGARVSDWITATVILLVASALVLFLNLIAGAVAGLALGFAAAAGLFFGVKRPALKRLDAAVEEVRKLAREIRRKGVPDASIDLFVCRHGGKFGEVVCEEMSGYEAMAATRAKRSQEELEKAQRPFGQSAREGFIRWISRAEEKREEEKRKALAPAASPSGESSAAAASAETEVYIAQVVEEKKPRANPAVAIPKFLLGGKGRVTVGAVLLLLAGLALGGKAFADSAVLKSYAFAALALALLLSGFPRSKVMIACFLLAFLAGLATVLNANALAVLDTKAPFLGGETGPRAQMTYGFLLSALFILLAFVAAYLLRAKEAKGGGKSD